MNTDSNSILGSVMLLFHNAITRGLDVSKKQIANILESNNPKAAITASFETYLRTFVWVLISHHSTEDDVVFPPLKPLIKDAPYDTLASDHIKMGHLLNKLQDNLEGLTGQTQPKEPLNQLNNIVSELTDIWFPHIDTETRFFFGNGKIEAVMTVEEQMDLLRKASQHVPPQGTQSMILPFVYYNLIPEERLQLGKSMPPELTQKLIPTVWKNEWFVMQPFFLD